MLQNWTVNNIPDLTGKIIIVTGANSGIGYETAREVARKGAYTILACRNMELAQTALNRIEAEISNASVKAMYLDLANLATIRDFAQEFIQNHNRLDVLVNNAGIMMGPYGTTVDGFERQFGINHLGHFALTGLLLNVLINTPDSRVVNVSSNGHRFGKMDFDNLMYEGGNSYNPVRAYGRSKLANLLFTYELQRRFEAKGINAKAVAAHPGVSHTNLTNHMSGQWFLKVTKPLQARLLPSAAMGALPTLRASVDEEVKGGQYYGPDGFIEQSGYPVLVESNQESHSLEDAGTLWDISERLTGVSFKQLSQTD